MSDTVSAQQITPTWGYLRLDYWTFTRLATGGKWSSTRQHATEEELEYVRQHNATVARRLEAGRYSRA